MERILRSKSRALGLSSSSEPKAKRVKVEASLDPLENLHSDVHELIFQHFDSEDSLRASEVSRGWNEHTEGSLKCCEKLELKLHGYRLWLWHTRYNRPMDKIFRSSRKYQKIFLLHIDDSRELLGEIMSLIFSLIRGRKWSSVKMDHFDCGLDQLKAILKMVEPTVETLHIEGSKFKSSPSNSAGSSSSQRDDDTMKYPKLKDLLITCNAMLLKDIAGACKTLEKFKVFLNTSDPAVDDDSLPSSVNKILENNGKLKELFGFGHGNVQAFPIQSTRNHQFKLKSLTVPVSSTWRDADDDRLLNFLKSQACNLEELIIRPGANLEILKTILKMPKLKKVEFHLDDRRLQLIADWNNIDFNRNPTIESFHLNLFLFDLNENKSVTDFLDNLFQSIPNCQQLNLIRLNGSALRSLAQHCPKIKKLKVHDLEIQDIDELIDFPAIESFDLYVRNHLLTRIEAKPEEERTCLQKLILQAGETPPRVIRTTRRSGGIYSLPVVSQPNQ